MVEIYFQLSVTSCFIGRTSKVYLFLCSDATGSDDEHSLDVWEDDWDDDNVEDDFVIQLR